MRLVDADALRDELERCPFMAQDSTAELMQARTVFVLIDAAPTIACERCRHHKERFQDIPHPWCAPVGYHHSDFGCSHFEAAE